MGHRDLVGFVLTLVVFTNPVIAATTGQLSGRALDDQDSPLPGVSVTASSPAQIGGELRSETDLGGLFVFPRLAPGVYTVRLSLDGFITQELTSVQVRLDRVTEVRVVLPLAQFGDQVQVTEEVPVMDPTQVSVGQTLTSEYLELTSVGAQNRSYWAALSQVAGSSEMQGWGWMETSVLGSSFSENAYLIDGLDTTDIFYGGVGTFLNFEAIDEISMQTGGFEAEYGRATGGVVNLVTKSGGNDLRVVFDTRYRTNDFAASGKYFDPQEQDSSLLETSLAAGGPITRDKIWYFVSGFYHDRQRTPFQAPTTHGDEGYDVLGKITWQLSPAWRLMGKYNTGNRVNSNTNSGQFVQPEAGHEWDENTALAQLDADGVLTDKVLWSGNLARNSPHGSWGPHSGDIRAPGHFDVSTDVLSGNSSWYGEDERQRTAVRSDLTVFADDLAGSHQIKGGLEYHQIRDETRECRTGDTSDNPCAPGSEGISFLDGLDPLGNESPIFMWVTEALGQQRAEGDLISAFLQDAWKVRPDLTVNLGLRWDGVSYTNDLGADVADLDKFQPRLGAAWDVTGSGKNLLRASWGQFMHPGTTALPAMSSSRLGEETWYSCMYAGIFFGFDPGLCPIVADSLGWSWRTDPWGWDPMGWMLEPTRDMSLPSVVVDGLRPSYNEQFILGFERQIYRRTSLELSYINKETKDGIDDTCRGNVPEPTPGAACDFFVIANLPAIRKEYEAWMARFESRPTDKLHLLGSYVYSESKGSVWSTSTFMEGTFDIYPYHFVNRFGYLPDHRRHRVKLNGFALLPLGFQLGFSGWWSSPFHWNPVGWVVDGMDFGRLFLEPRGSREAEDNHQLDLQASKVFRVGPTSLQLIASVYNLFNIEQPIFVCEDADGCGEYELGAPTAWQLPRRFELGLRVEF